MSARRAFLACVALCVVSEVRSVVSPEFGPGRVNAASNAISPTSPALNRYPGHLGLSASDGSATRSTSGTETDGAPAAGSAIRSEDALAGDADGTAATERMKENQREKLPSRKEVLAVEQENIADVKAACEDISTGERRGGLFVTPTDADWAPPGACIRAPSLNLAQAETAARAISGADAYNAVVPSCPGLEAHSPMTGGACTYAEQDLLTKLYDSGVAFMVIGADRDEAFAPFLHARKLAWTLRCCQPRLHPEGLVALPHSYAVLYDVLSTKLGARLRSSWRSAPTSKKVMKQVLESDKIQRLRSAALSVGLDRDFDSDSLLPADGQFKTVSHFSPVARARRLYEGENVTNVETVAGAAMVESQCDEAMPSKYLFTLRKLPGYLLDSRFEVCCAAECFLIQTTTKSLIGLENCCAACNRHRCEPLGTTGLQTLAAATKIVVVAKTDVVAEVVSIAV
jgi:hypothetical protein